MEEASNLARNPSLTSSKEAIERCPWCMGSGIDLPGARLGKYGPDDIADCPMCGGEKCRERD